MVMTLAPGALESEHGDEEAFLIDSEKDIVLKPRDERWRIILGFILTASLALIAGVLLEHYLFSNKDWACTSHVSQNSECSTSDQSFAQPLTPGQRLFSINRSIFRTTRSDMMELL